MNQSKNRRYIVWGSVLAGLAILYIIIAVTATGYTVRKFNSAYFASVEQKKSDTIDMCSVPGYTDLIRKKAFLSAQIRMAESDSIGLLINVRDSIIQLLIKGLPIRSIPISDYEISPFFYRAGQEAVFSMLSDPLVITGMKATFKKEPVRVKIAPRDTSEAVVDVRPDTTDFESVFYSLDTERYIRFCFEQQEDTVLSDRYTRFFFNLMQRTGNAGSSFRMFTGSEKPAYTPYVRIWLPKAEAKIVYRAIPRKGLIVFTY